MVEASCVLKMHITGMASTGQRLAAQLALPILQLFGMIDFLCLFQCHIKHFAAKLPCMAFPEHWCTCVPGLCTLALHL